MASNLGVRLGKCSQIWQWKVNRGSICRYLLLGGSIEPQLLLTNETGAQVAMKAWDNNDQECAKSLPVVLWKLYRCWPRTTETCAASCNYFCACGSRARNMKPSSPSPKPRRND